LRTGADKLVSVDVAGVLTVVGAIAVVGLSWGVLRLGRPWPERWQIAGAALLAAGIGVLVSALRAMLGS
jgi:hypothetical protein